MVVPYIYPFGDNPEDKIQKVPFGEAHVVYVDDLTSLHLRGSFRRMLFPSLGVEARFFPAGFLRQAESEDGSAEEARSENGLFPLISLHGRVWEPHHCADVPLG